MADLLGIAAALAAVFIPLVCAKLILAGQTARHQKKNFPKPLKISR